MATKTASDIKSLPAWGGWLGAWMVWVALSVIALLFVASGLWTSFPPEDGIIFCGGGFCDTFWDMYRDRKISDAKLLVYAMGCAAGLGLCVLWLHLTRSRHARPAYICWLPMVALLPLCISLYPWSLGLLADAGVPPFILTSLSRAPILLFVAVIFVSGVGLFYFLRSRRVRDTFVH